MIGIYLSAKNDTEGFRIPVNPPELPFKNTADGEEFSIAKKGTVNVPKPMKLTEFAFSSFFPADDTHYAETQFKEPQIYIDQINKWMAAETVIRFIYVGGSFSVNELVTIESFEPKDQFGTEDVDYTISFKKHVPFGFKKMEVVKKNAAKKGAATKQAVTVAKKEAPRDNPKPVPQTYSLVKGIRFGRLLKSIQGMEQTTRRYNR